MFRNLRIYRVRESNCFFIPNGKNMWLSNKYWLKLSLKGRSKPKAWPSYSLLALLSRWRHPRERLGWMPPCLFSDKKWLTKKIQGMISHIWRVGRQLQECSALLPPTTQTREQTSKPSTKGLSGKQSQREREREKGWYFYMQHKLQRQCFYPRD